MRHSDFDSFIKLGEGTEGTVYRATQKSLERKVLVKIIPQTGFDNKKKAFDMVQAISSLSIDGLPRLYGAYLNQKNVCIVSEYIKGIALSESSWQKWSLNVRLYTALSICEIITRLHEKKWAHGDLKPSNILLSIDGNLFLTDLGFTHSKNSARRFEIQGTPAYMAPECIKGGNYDPLKADLYALALLTIELVTGNRPNNGGIDQLSDSDVTLLSSLGLLEILKSTLAFKPEERLKTSIDLGLSIRQNLSTNADVALLKIELSALVEPIYIRFMSTILLQTAQLAHVTNDEFAYRLLCESIELNPDNSDAIMMLETQAINKAKPQITYYVSDALLALSILVIVLVSIFKMDTKNDRSSLIDSLQTPSVKTVSATFATSDLLSGNKFVSERVLVTTTGAIDHDTMAERNQVLSSEDSFVYMDNKATNPFNAQLSVNGIPERTTVLLDMQPMTTTKGSVQIAIHPGEHEIKVFLNEKIVWSKKITLLPFENLSLDLNNIVIPKG